MVPRERFVIERQVAFKSPMSYMANMTFTSGNVPGRVLDIIKGEILMHMPDLEDRPELDETVDNIVRRLARGEDCDFDAGMKADKKWNRGVFAPKKETA